MRESLAAAIAFFEADRLRYIVQLKYIHLYGEQVRTMCVDGGVLLTLPTRATLWDVREYPNFELMLLPAALDTESAATLVNVVRENFAPGVVFKFCEPVAKAAFRAAFDLKPTRTLYTYTLSPGAALPETSAVMVSTQLDDACMDLYAANGYSREKMGSLFAGDALAFTIYDDGAAVSGCFAYQNFDNIWEVAGVRTLEAARRKGYGRLVVAAALRTLHDKNLILRYQVESTNAASVQLAEALGMTRYLEFEHYVWD